MIANKKTIVNIIKVSASNILKLLAGILVGFLLPQIIGVTDYGYYKTFTLYASYVGLFHFGLADGIYLKYGAKNYDELNKEDFRYYILFYSLLEAFISMLIGIIAIIFMDNEYQFIFICEAIYLLAMNITNLYQLISQITNRFSELSFRNTVNSGLTVLSLVILLMMKQFHIGETTYKIYTIMYIAITVVLAVWYIYTYRDITFGKHSYHKNGDMIAFFKVGFPLMLSNLCSSLVLTLDRQFVNILFDIDTYAVYAFAYSMLNLVTVAISAISTVLYPTLKRTDKKILNESYTGLVAIIQCLVFACITIYFPLHFFILTFLPNYSGSLDIFRIIFPGLAISSVITIVMHTYYKVFEWTVIFFKKCIFILTISFCANAIAYFSFGTPTSISVASIITLIIWYLLVQKNIVSAYKQKYAKNLIYIFVLMLLFYLTTAIESKLIGMIGYIITYAITTIIIYKEELSHFWTTFKKKR